ncbi:MAG TPA: alkaline phosphatase, partial [Polyangiales bacterium]
MLLVEGAHIDKQSHAMDAERAVDDTIEFDRAVAVVRNFAENVDRRTVVVVLADHECSGFSIIGALNGSVANLQALPPDGAVTDPSVVPARQAAVGTYDLAGFPQYNILADSYQGRRTLPGAGQHELRHAAGSNWLAAGHRAARCDLALDPLGQHAAGPP